MTRVQSHAAKWPSAVHVASGLLQNPQRFADIRTPHCRHPLIVALKDKLSAAESEDTVDDKTVATARLLYEAALLESGFVPEDAKAFSQRMYGMLKDSLGVESLDVELEEAEELEQEQEAKEEPKEEGEAPAEEAEAKDEL